MTETRYLIPGGATWAAWEDVNAALSFWTDEGAVRLARDWERDLGEEFGSGLALPPDPTAEQAWAYVNELWAGDPGGRGWQIRIPRGATWLSLRDDEDDPARGAGPLPEFGFGEPPATAGRRSSISLLDLFARCGKRPPGGGGRRRRRAGSSRSRRPAPRA